MSKASVSSESSFIASSDTSFNIDGTDEEVRQARQQAQIAGYEPFGEFLTPGNVKDALEGCFADDDDEKKTEQVPVPEKVETPAKTPEPEPAKPIPEPKKEKESSATSWWIIGGAFLLVAAGLAGYFISRRHAARRAGHA